MNAIERKFLGQLNTREYKRLPYVQPILDVRCGGCIEEMLELGRGIAFEYV
jgi:hypothetical protein